MANKKNKKLNPRSRVKVKALSGSMVEYRHCVGKCKLHKCFLTSTQLKSRQCILKECRSLVKILDNPYWDAKARLNELKKEHKKEKKAMLESISTNTSSVPRKKRPKVVYKTKPSEYSMSIGDLIKISSSNGN